MKKYDTYKDSGNQWIGQVPEHWCLYSLKYYLNLQKGRKPEEFLEEGDLPYVTMDYIRSRENKTCLYPSSAEGLVPISDDDILVLWDGANAGEIVKAKKGFLSSTMAVLDFDKKIGSHQYLFYLLKQMEPIFKTFANGTTIPHFDSSILLDYKYPLPPLSEQQAIVEYLDKKTGQIDKSIALLETQKIDLQAYRQALITETVTKGLNPNAPMKDSGIQWIGEIPEHWNTSKLKYMGESRNGLTYSPNDVTDSGVLVLRSSNIQGSRLAFEDNVYVEKAPDFLRMHKGDLLVCSRNGSISLVGKCAYIPEDMEAVFGAFMLRYRPNKPNRFVYYVVQDAIRNYKAFYATSTVNQLTVDIFGNMHVPLPPLSEQNAIADYLDKKTSDIDAALKQIDTQIADLQAYRTALISEAVTGKIDVRNQ